MSLVSATWGHGPRKSLCDVDVIAYSDGPCGSWRQLERSLPRGGGS